MPQRPWIPRAATTLSSSPDLKHGHGRRLSGRARCSMTDYAEPPFPIWTHCVYAVRNGQMEDRRSRKGA
jgi:hypothetical protein